MFPIYGKSLIRGISVIKGSSDSCLRSGSEGYTRICGVYPEWKEIKYDLFGDYDIVIKYWFLREQREFSSVIGNLKIHNQWSLTGKGILEIRRRLYGRYGKAVYKRRSRPVQVQQFKHILFFIIITLVYRPVFFIMTQGQLLGNGGEVGKGGGIHKRLKISVPHFDNSALIKGYSKTLIGRCMNPMVQDVKALLVMLPKIWKLEHRVGGADLGLGKFQFDFEKEEDIEAVLKMQPFHFDYWMLSLVRWQPKQSNNYPSDITFWVMPLGVPLEYWAAPTFKSIGDAIGETLEVDADMGRVRVVLDGFKQLIFEISVDFTGGEFHEGDEVPITPRYEKLFGYCLHCYSLCHDQEHRPLFKKEPDRIQLSRPSSNGSVLRPQSYEGVVINGAEGRQVREDYLGKGKGKVSVDGEAQWKRAADRGSRRIVNRSTNGIDRDDYRHRSSYIKFTRNKVYDVHSTSVRSQWREKIPPRILEVPDKIEEGEIILNGRGKNDNDYNVEGSTNPLAIVKEVPQLVQEVIFTQSKEVGEIVDEGVKENTGGDDKVTVSGEDFENLTDEESEAFENLQDQGIGLTEGEVMEMQEVMEQVEEVDPVEKKKTARKMLFKQATMGGGSTKNS